MEKSDSPSFAVATFGMIGTIIAGLVSWSYTHNFWYTLLHMMFGWLYVIYRGLVGWPG